MAETPPVKVPSLKGIGSKKIAGIPAIYLILGIVAIGLYSAIKMKKTPTVADPTTDPTIQGDTSTDTSQPVFTATPTITQPSGVNTGSVTAVSGPDTDDLWKRRAIAYLIANGYTLDVATSAISKYLAGQAMSSTEAGARDKAVQQFGLPPESVPDIGVADPTGDPVSTDPLSLPTAPTPTETPAAKQGVPPLNHVVKGSFDNQLGDLARLYYGSTEDDRIKLLRSYNPSYTIWAVIPNGTSVHIPAYVVPRYYVATSATRTLANIAQKNGTTGARVSALNPGVHFPVNAGVRVRVR